MLPEASNAILQLIKSGCNRRIDAADGAHVQKQNLNAPACAVAVVTENVIRSRMAAILLFVSVN